MANQSGPDSGTLVGLSLINLLSCDTISYYFFGLLKPLLLFAISRIWHHQVHPPVWARTPEKTDKHFPERNSPIAFVFKDIMEWYTYTSLLLSTTFSFLALTSPSTLSAICPYLPSSAFLQRSDAFYFVTLLCIFGGWLRLTSYYQLGRRFTFHLMIRKGHELEMGGMYRYIRHPGYLGSMVIHTGVGMLVGGTAGSSSLSTISVGSRMGVGAEQGIVDAPYACFLPEGSWGRWVNLVVAWGVIGATPALLAWKRVRGEEKMMEEEFGEKWREYKRRTWYLVPGVF